MPSALDEGHTRVGQPHSNPLPVSAKDKSMAETVKTRDGTMDDPCLYGTSHPKCLDRTESYQSNRPAYQARNSSETMTYLTLVALMMFVLSPVLVPLVITGVHTIGNLRTA
jgi:hypothetical protein